MNEEIYQDIVLSHFRKPKWKKAMDFNRSVEIMRNPACGDIIRLQYVEGEAGELEWHHHAEGCAASVASCSIMCSELAGRSRVDAMRLIRCFISALQGGKVDAEELGMSMELEALLYFRKNPARMRCVELAWECAHNALADLPSEQ